MTNFASVSEREMIVLILAPDQRGLQEVFGVPAIGRLVLICRQLGLADLHVIGTTGSLPEDLVPCVHLHPVDDPSSLASAIRGISPADGTGILVFRADQVLDKPGLSRFLQQKTPAEVSFLEAGENGGRERVYFTSARRLDSVLNDAWGNTSGDPEFAGDGLVPSPNGLPLRLDGSTSGKKRAEEALLNSSALQTRESDGLLARYVSRRISRAISRTIAGSGITPNQVTVFAALLGLAGALFLGSGGYWNQVVGSLLFLFCVIIDGVDGEVARLKLQESSGGGKLDLILDNTVHAAVFLGMAVGLYRELSDVRYLYLGGLLLGGFVAGGIVAPSLSSKFSWEEFRFNGKIPRVLELFRNRDFAYLVLAIALIGELRWFLTAAAVGSWVYALLVVIGSRLARPAYGTADCSTTDLTYPFPKNRARPAEIRPRQ